MLIVIKGAGDLASGTAARLFRAGLQVVMTDLPQPTCIRRTVSFSDALIRGTAEVEGIIAERAECPEDALQILRRGRIPVIADPEASCIRTLKPSVVIDGILAKKNLGTSLQDAPVVIALGPGFEAGTDCHAVIETKRGHDLGRVYYTGRAAENTGVPGNIGGYTAERILRAPCAGKISPVKAIGDIVEPGEVCAYVDGTPMVTCIGGVLRGILPEGIEVTEGMKSGDVDPRGTISNCYTISDKASAIGGGALEAVLHLTGALKNC